MGLEAKIAELTDVYRQAPAVPFAYDVDCER